MLRVKLLRCWQGQLQIPHREDPELVVSQDTLNALQIEKLNE
jgi:hypothetical protein